MKQLLSILAISMLLPSCTTTYHFQVLETASDNPKIKTDDKQTQYEDENCIVSYDMWESNGKAGFLFYNKTDQIITIDLAKTYFVRNGEAFDYYAEEVISRTNSASSSTGNGIYWGYGISTVNSKSVSNSYQSTIVLPSVITIPPKSHKTIRKFEIKEGIIRLCDLTIDPQEKTEPINFDKSNSPFTFSNIITYQVGDSESVTIYNDFYVQSVFNVISWKFYRYESKTNCDFRSKPKIREKYFLINPSNGFYIKYEAAKYRNDTP